MGIVDEVSGNRLNHEAFEFKIIIWEIYKPVIKERGII